MVANIRPMSPSMGTTPQLPASTAQTVQKKKSKVKKEPPPPPPPPPKQVASTSAPISGPSQSTTASSSSAKPLITRVFSPLKFQAAPEQVGQGRDRAGDSAPVRGKYHTKWSKPKRAQETLVTEQSTAPGQGEKQVHFFHYKPYESKEMMEESAVYRDLQLQEWQGASSSMEKEQYTWAYDLPGRNVTKAMDELVPGKKQVSILTKGREPSMEPDWFNRFVTRIKTMPNNYSASLKVSLAP